MLVLYKSAWPKCRCYMGALLTRQVAALSWQAAHAFIRT